MWRVWDPVVARLAAVEGAQYLFAERMERREEAGKELVTAQEGREGDMEKTGGEVWRERKGGGDKERWSREGRREKMHSSCGVAAIMASRASPLGERYPEESLCHQLRKKVATWRAGEQD